MTRADRNSRRIAERAARDESRRQTAGVAPAEWARMNVAQKQAAVSATWTGREGPA